VDRLKAFMSLKYTSATRLGTLCISANYSNGSLWHTLIFNRKTKTGGPVGAYKRLRRHRLHNIKATFIIDNPRHLSQTTGTLTGINSDWK